HSCRISIEAVQGQEITTIEALCEDETGRMVIAEFLQEQAAQCGYCINGLLVSLTGLLKSNPARSRDEVIKFLDERHLCRCGAHPRILRVIARLFPAQVQNGTA